MSGKECPHVYQPVNINRKLDSKHLLKMFQFSYGMLQFELDKIQGRIGPVDPRKVGYDKTHAKLALADIVKAAIRITAILRK